VPLCRSLLGAGAAAGQLGAAGRSWGSSWAAGAAAGQLGQLGQQLGSSWAAGAAAGQLGQLGQQGAAGRSWAQQPLLFPTARPAGAKVTGKSYESYESYKSYG
jgi:hypothetical protein